MGYTSEVRTSHTHLHIHGHGDAATGHVHMHWGWLLHVFDCSCQVCCHHDDANVFNVFDTSADRILDWVLNVTAVQVLFFGEPFSTPSV